MTQETYLNHPTFGLLFSLCSVDEHRQLFTTLYAQRLFFLVSSEGGVLQFEPVSRADAKMMVENRLRVLRRSAATHDYAHLQTLHRRTFQ